MALQRQLRSGAIQAKLAVSTPGDVYEQEADRVAEQVSATGSVPPVQRKCGCGGAAASGGECEECRAAGTPAIQRSAAGAGGQGADTSQAVRGVPSTGGSPLDSSSRAFMESRFGQDFGGVRVHTDAHAAESARALNARAYTSGRDVVFAAGEYAPGSAEGRRLLAHELTHVVQQGGGPQPERGLIQRQPAGGGKAGGDDQAGDKAAPPQPEQTVPAQGSKVVPFGEIVLSDDRGFMHFQMTRLIMKLGLKGADNWMRALSGPRISAPPPVFLPGHMAATGVYRPRSPLDAIRDEQNKKLREEQEKLIPVLVPIALEVYGEVRNEAVKFLDEFEKKAKENLSQVLEAQKTQAKAEGIRYGITAQTIEKVRYHVTGEGPREKETSYETSYSMDRGSPAAKGLQAAAQVLLGRRREIDDLEKKQRQAVKLERDPYDPKGRIYVPTPEYHIIGQEINEKKESYNNIRTQLAAEFPALAAFSDLSQGTGDLETLVSKGAGPDMAALLGQKIAEKLANIEKVKAGLETGEVNVWRLPKIIDVTAIQFGTASDAEKAKLVEEKREDEQPGILGDIALLVLNVAAIVLAGPTGGVSLAVAAGVNAVVAAEHVQEYLMKEAMAGTAFDKAQAISQEDPSLFWLAVEIVGVAVDVGTAASALFKTFKSLAPLVKAAEAATKGEEAVKSLEAVRTAATAERGATFAERVVARIKSIRGGGKAAALEVAGATRKEVEVIETAARAVEQEAAAGIGKAVKTATGEVNIAQSGHLFSCASPCLILRDKYAEIFAKDENLMNELRRLEAEAEKAAQARKAAANADELAKVEAQADKIKQEAAALEKRIQDANPHLLAAPDEEAVVTAAKQAEAESAVTKGRLTQDAGELEKLKPLREKPPAGVAADDPLWQDYVAYFEDRLSCVKAGKKGIKPPLSWEGYSDFLGKFRRGTNYQSKVLGELGEEAQRAAGERKLFEGMQEPVVESNVGVAGKQPGETTKFADQLVVDKASIGPGKTPRVESFSNKSRVWPDKIGAAERSSVRSQVVADAEEALTKYGGDITLRRPDGPLKELYNQTVKVGKVTLIYDKAYVKTPELEKLIIDAASGVKINGQQVTVIFIK